jgi:hypothetical protein
MMKPMKAEAEAEWSAEAVSMCKPELMLGRDLLSNFGLIVLKNMQLGLGFLDWE